MQRPPAVQPLPTARFTFDLNYERFPWPYQPARVSRPPAPAAPVVLSFPAIFSRRRGHNHVCAATRTRRYSGLRPGFTETLATSRSTRGNPRTTKTPKITGLAFYPANKPGNFPGSGAGPFAPRVCSRVRVERAPSLVVVLLPCLLPSLSCPLPVPFCSASMIPVITSPCQASFATRSARHFGTCIDASFAAA